MQEAEGAHQPESDLPRINADFRRGASQRPECPPSVTGKLKNLLLHLQGFLLMRKLRLKHAGLLRRLRPLAAHLENNLFPILIQEQRKWLTLQVSGNDSEWLMEGSSGTRRFPLSGTEASAKWFRHNGIRGIRLDTRLESGQIIEAFLLLFHAIDSLPESYTGDEGYSGWSPRKMAAAMRSMRGYHKFCALMRFDPDEKVYEVEYSYCDLLFSRMVTTYLERQNVYQDHRVLLRLVPRVFVVSWIILLLPDFGFFYSTTWGVVISLVTATLGAAALAAGIRTIASVQYSREHQDSLARELLHQVAALSRFPEANPNLVLKMSPEGEVLYLNPTTRRVLQEMGFGEEEAERILPEERDSLIRECVTKAPETHDLEFEIGERVFHYRLSPFPNEKSVIVSGTDVTYLKHIEHRLRELNEDLEGVVQERTDELRKTQEVTILSLARLAETRDQETGRHLERTRLYVKVLAEHLRHNPRFAQFLDKRTIEHLYKSTPLHDIGKVGVRDAILLKPGKLTTEEFEEMKRHTVYGGDALRWANERLGFDSFLRVGQEIAYHHHERWDGRGYPYGLTGDEIPWAARLMALADVYDALSSRRVYKNAFSHEMTRGIILDGRGNHFDPDVVDAYLAQEDEFVRITLELADD